VALAVRVPPSSSFNQVDEEDEDTEEADGDEDELDTFFSSHGFEYVDASSESSSTFFRSPVSLLQEQEIDDDGDEGVYDSIPRLPRVVDALSTIMWASMQALTRPSASNVTNSRSNPRNKLDWAPNSASSILTSPSLFSPVSSSSLPLSGKNKEIHALAQWLDSSSQEDPWAHRTGGISMSPTDELDGGFAFGGKDNQPNSDSKETEKWGFEDDFTVFVSAPPSTDPNFDLTAVSFPADGEETEERKGAGLSVGALYTALESKEDLTFREEDSPRQDVDDDDDDEGMPTKDEIRKTAGIIFGSTKASAAPSDEPPRTKSLGLDDADDDNGADESDADFSPFDLPRVFSALQGMKAEIAAMTDPEEKRRAAARVALGLVYGLEGEEV